MGGSSNSKDKAVFSSTLVAGLFRAILEGARYPEALYSNTLLRIRATRKATSTQVAIIKAYLIRNAGFDTKELTVELNEQNASTAYLLGRVFALLERIQYHANGKNVTITGRYLDSASSRPAVVYPVLLRLASAHLTKIKKDKPGLEAGLSRELSELLSRSGAVELPKHLSLIEQGQFFLGYYQQKNAVFSKKSQDEGLVGDDENAMDQEA